MATSLASPIQTQARKNTRGYSPVQNSLIENMALLTHAELVLLLAVSRRGDGCHISDANWTLWTGLKPRQKDYAIQGLAQKGLRMDGRGKDARFSIAWNDWHAYVLKATPPEVVKPRTKGRSVAAPAGARMHEECAANGCKMLCEEKAGCVPGAVATAQTMKKGAVTECGHSGAPDKGKFVQPVAQTNTGIVRIDTRTRPANVQPVAQNSHPSLQLPIQSNQQDKSMFVQPVAQTVLFAKTFAAIRERFPDAGEQILIGLLENIRKVAAQTPDDETLAGMIVKGTHRKQYSAALYLANIPRLVLAWSESQSQSPAAVSFDAVLRDLKALASRGTSVRPAAKQTIQAIENTDWTGMPSAAARRETLQAVAAPLLELLGQLARGRPTWPAYWKDLNTLFPGSSAEELNRMEQIDAANDAGLASLVELLLG